MIDNFDQERYALLSLRCVGLRITSTSAFPSKGILSNFFGRSNPPPASQAKNEKRWMILSQSEVFPLGLTPTNLKFEHIYSSEVFEDIPELNLCLLARIKLQPGGFDSQVRVTVFYSSTLSSGKDVVLGTANFKEKELLRMVSDAAYGVFMSDMPNEYCQGTKILIERIPLLPQPLEDKIVPITAQKYEKNPLFQNYVFYPKPDSMSPNLIVTEQSWEPKFTGVISLMFLNNLLASLIRSCSAWQHRKHLERIRQARFHSPQEAINYGWHVVMITVKAARIASNPDRTGALPVPSHHSNVAYQHHFPFTEDHVTELSTPLPNTTTTSPTDNRRSTRGSSAHNRMTGTGTGTVAASSGGSRMNIFSNAATIRKHDEYLPSTYISILIEDTTKTFIEPVGRTNTEHFTLFPVYGSNLNGQHSRKLNGLLATTYVDTVTLDHVEKEFIFQIYETFQRVYTPRSWAWLPLSLKATSNDNATSNRSSAAKSQGSGDNVTTATKSGDAAPTAAEGYSKQGDGGRGGPGLGEEPIGFHAITGKVYSFTKYVSNATNTSIKLELFVENVSASHTKKVGIATIPITEQGSFTGWLPLTMLSTGLEDGSMASCDAAEVLVEVTILSPPADAGSNHNGTVDSMPEVIAYNRAADGSVEPATSEDYRRSLANCYEWMWTLGLNGYDPLMFDAAAGSAAEQPLVPAAVSPATAAASGGSNSNKKPLSLQQTTNDRTLINRSSEAADSHTPIQRPVVISQQEAEQAVSDDSDEEEESEGHEEDFQQTIHAADDGHRLSHHERERIQSILHDVRGADHLLSTQHLQDIAKLSDEIEEEEDDDYEDEEDVREHAAVSALPHAQVPAVSVAAQHTVHTTLPMSQSTAADTATTAVAASRSRTTSTGTNADKSPRAQIIKQYSPLARRSSQGGAGVFPSTATTTALAADQLPAAEDAAGSKGDSGSGSVGPKPPKPPRRNSLRTINSTGTATPTLRADCPYSLAWIDGHIRSLRQIIEEVETIINHVQAFVSIDRTFRSSVLKKQIERQALPTNLHYQVMGVRLHGTKSAEHAQMEVIHSVSCGAMTPHMLKHKKGGLYHQEGRLITLKYDISRLKDLFAHQVREHGNHCISTTSDNKGQGTYHTMQILAERAMNFDQQSVEVCRRRMFAISQSLSIAINAFLLKLNLLCAELIPSVVADSWLLEGFLIVFEGLLSVIGAERSMLEDTISAVEALKLYRIRLLIYEEEEEDRRREISFDIKGREVMIYLPRRVASKLPESYQARMMGSSTAMGLGAVLILCPVLFTQGIDMQQTMANTFGSDTSSAELQNLVNRAGYVDINRYAHATQRITYDSNGMSAYHTHHAKDLPTHPLVQELSTALSSSEEHLTLKNVDLLDALERLVVVLHGVRVTFCKSGKDRTGMAITLEQAKQLTTRYGIACSSSSSSSAAAAAAALSSAASTASAGSSAAVSQQQKEKELSDERLLQTANLLRVHGTRLMVAEKNIGRFVYSINLLQARFLPPLLRPPPSVCEAMLKKDNS